MSESEREQLCRLMNCQKLSLEACTHAAQNERLPLRAVLQVLFFEQLQLRRAITGTLLASSGPPQARQQQQAAVQRSVNASGAWRTTAVQESQVLRLDMDSMRSQVQELERECSSMRRAIKKIDGRGAGSPSSADADPDAAAAGSRPASWRSRYGCKFSTQVCDSHARNVVASRASRMGMSP